MVAKNPFVLRRFANRAEEALPELVSSEDIAKVRASAFVGEFEPAETKSYVVEESFEKDETLSWRDALSNKMSTIWEGRNKALKETVRVRAIDSLKQQRGEGGS